MGTPRLAALVVCSLVLVGAWGRRLGLDEEQAELRPGHHSKGPGVVRGCVKAAADGELSFSDSDCQGAVASGAYVPGLHTASGWGQLRVATSGTYSDAQQMRAAGFLEGYLSAEQIHAHRHNLGAHFNITSDEPIQWLRAQHAWASQQAEANAGVPFWRAMGLLLAQLDGLVSGYAEGARRAATEGRALPALGLDDFLFLSAIGDLDDIIPATLPARAVAWDTLTAPQVRTTLGSSGKCSALIKVDASFSDILISHSAWFTFAGLVRVYKHYDLELADPAIRLTGISFSSYPGELASDDDFYLTSTGLAILQTTNSIYNTSLYSLLTPESALSWQRARIASFLGGSGEEWVRTMDTHPSGTLNGQWMVLDLKRFSPGQELLPGLLWVLEQAPGMSVASDATMTLERGYWPSYNVPYHPAIYSWSGYPQFTAAQAARGPDFAAAVSGASYQLSPRAKIYRRDVGGVADLGAVEGFMRSNAWPHDPFNDGSPLHAICGRGDLDSQEPVAYGCIDTKMTNASMALERRAYAVVGPTTDGGRLAPFEWAGTLAQHTAHLGQPDRFDYQLDLMTPEDQRWGTPSDVKGAARAES